MLFAHVDTVVADPVRIAVPDPSPLNLAALSLSLLATVALMRLKFGIPATLALVGAIGLALRLSAG